MAGVGPLIRLGGKAIRLSGGLGRDSLERTLDGVVDATRLRIASREAELIGIGANGETFRTFTSGNFCENLKILTGAIPGGAQAHHVFPQKFLREFERLGINVHDPRFGAWWSTAEHARHSAKYNDAWGRFFRGDPTPSGAIDQARQLSGQYGYGVNF
jgi:hypothetical protein